MISTSATNTGLVRQNNEDCVRTDDELGIYLLADGMGGHNAGEVASALAVDTAFSTISTSLSDTAADCLLTLMANAMNAAHQEINSKSRTRLSFMGMGTTLVIVVVRADTAYIAHAGDSRAYLLSQHFEYLQAEMGRLKRITNDHTMGDQLLANGMPLDRIPEKQFHTLTQAVGYGEPPTPEFNTVELKQGDILLLCSDGLTDMLTDAEIESVLIRDAASLNVLADNLIEAANAKGGRDNISVVLVKIQ